MQKSKLEEYYLKFNDKKYLSLDPLAMVASNLSPADFELCSFISAGLSYGKVEQIQKSLHHLWFNLEKLGLDKNGQGLHRFLTEEKFDVK